MSQNLITFSVNSSLVLYSLYPRFFYVCYYFSLFVLTLTIVYVISHSSCIIHLLFKITKVECGSDKLRCFLAKIMQGYSPHPTLHIVAIIVQINHGQSMVTFKDFSHFWLDSQSRLQFFSSNNSFCFSLAIFWIICIRPFSLWLFACTLMYALD